MRRIVFAAALSAGMAICVLSQANDKKAAQSGNAEQEVRELIRNWDEAYMRRDTETLDRILAEDFVYTDASGAILNKTQYLMSIIKSPDMSQHSFESEEVKVRVYGDTAVAIGRSGVKGRSRGKGQFLGGPYRFTDVWVKQQGRWQAVATQGTGVAQ